MTKIGEKYLIFLHKTAKGICSLVKPIIFLGNYIKSDKKYVYGQFTTKPVTLLKGQMTCQNVRMMMTF